MEQAKSQSLMLKVFMFIWNVALLCVLGAIFNTAIAFLSLFVPATALIVAGLTGYALYKLFLEKIYESL